MLFLSQRAGAQEGNPSPKTSDSPCVLENVRKLSPPDISVWHPIWMPDSQHLVFSTLDSVKIASAPVDPMYIVDILGASKPQLIASGVNPLSIQIEPAGKQIAFKKRILGKPSQSEPFQFLDAVSRTPVKNSSDETEKWERARVRETLFKLKQPDIRTHQIVRADKKRQVVLTRKGGRHFLIDMLSGDVKNIQPQLPPKAHILGSDLAPDGRYIIFSVQLDRESLDSDVIGRAELFIADTNGRTWQLTDTSTIVEDGPTWSPDGRHLAYIDYQDQILRKGNSTLFAGEIKCK
jgi:Tol biopolymer transport system component